MSVFSALRSAYSYEDAFRAKDCTSQEMRAAIQEWFRLYYQREATEESDPCQQIAYTIVNKLAKTAFGEYAASSKDAFTQNVLSALGECRKKAMQLALVGGEAWLKPVPAQKGFAFSVVSRDNVLVFARDGAGIPTDIGTAEYAVEGRSWYTLLERRTVDGRGYLTIRNQLYRSEMPDTLGRPAPLGTLARYEALAEEYTFPRPLGGLGLARLKTPLENCVDGSKDGVSVYAPAVGLIHNIDRNEAGRLCGVLGQLYKVPEAHEVEADAVSIDWGNGILYDEDKTWADYLDMVGRGLLKPEIALGWRFGMSTETEADLAAIRRKYMPELQQLADGEL